MRRDLIHTPQLADEAGRCADCGAWLPVDIVTDALSIGDGAVLDVGGLGAYCVTRRESLGREAIPCSHPSAAAQSNEITISPCPTCDGEDASCEDCGGSGMIGLVPDPDDPDSPQIVKVSGGRLSDVQMDTEGLSIKESQPLSEVDKVVNRGAFQNWLALRDAIRPEDVESS